MKTGIYQLHIPRTSGVFIRNALYSYSKENNKKLLSGHNFEIDIKEFKTSDYITGHYGLTPVPYVSKSFTILRDPAERSFSYLKYVWKALYGHLAIDDAFEYFLNDKNIIDVISNQQSKFLTSDIDLELYNNNTKNIADHFLSGWALTIKDVDVESVLNSINKNNIEVLFFDDKELYKKVFNIFKLENKDSIDYSKKINQSIEIDKNFYNKYYDRILEINKIDIEVYNILRNESK
jgi:hypothetical protein